jgi:FkbM family methyltransferase
MYAIESGASAVYSYEPDPDLYKTLVRNIDANRLQSKIFAVQAAVVGRQSSVVTFYPEGNASGHIGAKSHDTQGILVHAATLSSIILDRHIETVDVLKLDCEGSEYDIIFNTPAEIWRRVERVRMEYHNGRANELAEYFEGLGFAQVANKPRSSQVGLLGFDRKATPQMGS